MIAEYRSTLKRAEPGCVCCGKFYLRQADAIAHLCKQHAVERLDATALVDSLVRQARGVRKRMIKGSTLCQ